MVQEKVVITNESGLHARPATAFTQLAAKYQSKISLECGDKRLMLSLF